MRSIDQLALLCVLLVVPQPFLRLPVGVAAVAWPTSCRVYRGAADELRPQPPVDDALACARSFRDAYDYAHMDDRYTVTTTPLIPEATPNCCPPRCLAVVRALAEERQGLQQFRQPSLASAAADTVVPAVYGSWPYHSNSSVCLAAIHSGVITDEDGGWLMMGPFAAFHHPLLLDLSGPHPDEPVPELGPYLDVLSPISGLQLFPLHSSQPSLSNGVQSRHAAEGWTAGSAELPTTTIADVSFVVHSRGNLIESVSHPPFSARSGHMQQTLPGLFGGGQRWPVSVLHLVVGGRNATHYHNDVWVAAQVDGHGPSPLPQNAARLQWMRLPDAPFSGRTDVESEPVFCIPPFLRSAWSYSPCPLPTFANDTFPVWWNLWLHGGQTGHHCGLPQLGVCSDEVWLLTITVNASSPTFALSFTWAAQPLRRPFSLCGAALTVFNGAANGSRSLLPSVVSAGGQRSYEDATCSQPIETTNELWYSFDNRSEWHSAPAAPFPPRRSASWDSSATDRIPQGDDLGSCGGGVRYISHTVNATSGLARLTAAELLTDWWACALLPANLPMCSWLHYNGGSTNASAPPSAVSSWPVPAMDGASWFDTDEGCLSIGGRGSREAERRWTATAPPYPTFNGDKTTTAINVTMITQPWAVYDPSADTDSSGGSPFAPTADDVDGSRYSLPLSYLLDEEELNDPDGPFLGGTARVTEAVYLIPGEYNLPTITSTRTSWHTSHAPVYDRQPASSFNTTRRLFDVSRRHSVASSVLWGSSNRLSVSGGESSGAFYSDWLTVARMCCAHPSDPSYRTMLGNGSVIAATGINLTETFCLDPGDAPVISWRCADGSHLEPSRVDGGRQAFLRCTQGGAWMDADYNTMATCVRDRLNCTFPEVEVAGDSCTLPAPFISSIRAVSNGVSNCNSTDPLTLVDCPLRLTTLFIAGEYFTQPLMVWVGGTACVEPVLQDSHNQVICSTNAQNVSVCATYGTGLACSLPPLLGYGLPITLLSGVAPQRQLSGSNLAVLSFSAPTMRNLTAVPRSICQQEEDAYLHLTSCPFDRTFTVTVNGTNWWLDDGVIIQPPSVTLLPLTIACAPQPGACGLLLHCMLCDITPSLSVPLGVPIALLLRQAGGQSNLVFGGSALSPATVALSLCPAGSRDIGQRAASISERCQPCPAGSYSDGVDAPTVCMPCLMGTHASSPGSPSCTPCSAQSFANETGMASCLPCPPNSYQLSEGASDCHVCDLNEYLLVPDAGLPQCRSCLSNTAAAAALWCLPNGTIRALSSDVYLVVDPEQGVVSSTECPASRCIAAADCAASGGDESTTTVERTRLSVQNCCSAHRLQAATNPLCAQCEAGYQEWNGQCVLCDGWQHVDVAALVISAVLGLLLVCLLHRVSSDHHTATLSIALYFVQTTLLLFSSEQLPQLLATLNLDLLGDWPRAADGSGTCLLPLDARGKIALKAAMPLLAALYLAPVLALQLSMRACLGTARGSSSRTLHALYGIAFGKPDPEDADVGVAAGATEAVGAGDGDRAAAAAAAVDCAPAAAGSALQESLLSPTAAVAYDSVWDSDGRGLPAGCSVLGPTRSPLPPRLRSPSLTLSPGPGSVRASAYLRTLVRLCVYGYTSVATVVLSYFHCHTVGLLGSFLYDYPAISCQDAQYRASLPFFVLALIVLVLLPPAGLAIVLYSQRERIARRMGGTAAPCSSGSSDAAPTSLFRPGPGPSPQSIHASGSSSGGLGTSMRMVVECLDVVYGCYRPGWAWYAVVILMRRLLLVAIFVFVPAGVSLAWLGCACGAVLALHAACWPYRRPRDNLVELCTLAVLCLQCAVLASRPLPWRVSDASSIGGIGTSTGGTAVSVLLLLVLVAAPVVLIIGTALLDRVSKARALWMDARPLRQPEAGQAQRSLDDDDAGDDEDEDDEDRNIVGGPAGQQRVPWERARAQPADCSTRPPL